MDESRDEHEQHPPRWVPYTPPPPDGWDRLRLLLRRLSFPLVVVLLGAGLAGVFFYGSPEVDPQSEASSAVPVRAPGVGGAELGRVPEKGVGRLRVQSSPTGATIRVNGDSVGVTPFTDSLRQAGVYLVSLQREGHFRSDTVVVLEEGAAANVRLALRPRPNYADEQAAVPPTTAKPPTARTGDRPQTRPSPVTAVPEAAPSPTASPVFGGLYVTSTPPGAVVTLNGAERGRTPLPLSQLRPGPQRVEVALAGYQPWSSQVDVTADTIARVHAELQSQTGRLRVLARPWGTIYINDALHARESDVWYETDLPKGTHQVTVVHPSLGKQTREVEVQEGKEHSVIIDLRSQEPESTAPEQR